MSIIKVITVKNKELYKLMLSLIFKAKSGVLLDLLKLIMFVLRSLEEFNDRRKIVKNNTDDS